jgi:hypothetical protein
MEIKDCCCKDIHRDTCFALRYPNYSPLYGQYKETCECSCHDQYDDDECDCCFNFEEDVICCTHCSGYEEDDYDDDGGYGIDGSKCISGDRCYF